MADLLIDLGIEEPLSSAPSSRYPSLMDRINASRKLEEECYKALEVCNVPRLLFRSHRSSLTTMQELIEENEKLMAENMSLKSQLTNTSADIANVLRQQSEASSHNLQIESLEQQLKAARLSMVRNLTTCIH